MKARRALARLLPRSFYAQIVSILVSSLVVTLFLVGFLLHTLLPSVPRLPDGLWPNTLAIETAIRSIRAAPQESRAAIAAGLSTPAFRFHVGQPIACTPTADNFETGLLRKMLARDFPQDTGHIIVQKCSESTALEATTNILLEKDGISGCIVSTLNFLSVLHHSLPVAVPVIALLIMAGALSIWSIWRVNRPLSILAEKADALGYDAVSPPLPEQGTLEVRRVIRAFNRMQNRLSAAASERTRMLMSISHDLRTPLTRLSMRVEMGGEDAAPDAMRNDLVLMKQMLNGALAFLKGQQETETFETVDLGSLLESLCEEFSKVGKDVTYHGAFRLPCFCQPVSMARAVGNLVENGIKYGRNVQVNAWSEDGQALIEVQDSGPGIPENMRLAMLQPFARMDRARSADGSLGLGLSIVQDIVSRHHGSISFHDASPSGLIVRLAFMQRLRKSGADPTLQAATTHEADPPSLLHQ